jgi:hypothetical protein
MELYCIVVVVVVVIVIIIIIIIIIIVVINIFVLLFCCKGHAVAQLVEALRYKFEGRGLDCRWCQWNFSLILSFRPHYGPGVDSASNQNKYQEYFLGVKAAGAYG